MPRSLSYRTPKLKVSFGAAFQSSCAHKPIEFVGTSILKLPKPCTQETARGLIAAMFQVEGSFHTGNIAS